MGGQIHENLSHEIILTRIISYKCQERHRLFAVQLAIGMASNKVHS